MPVESQRERVGGRDSQSIGKRVQERVYRARTSSSRRVVAENVIRI